MRNYASCSANSAFAALISRITRLLTTVWNVLSWLAAGMSEDEIFGDYPELEKDDFRAVYNFAACMGRRVAL